MNFVEIISTMSNNKFCPLPWYNISTDVNGSIRPCCRYAQPHIKTTEYNENQPDFPMPWLQDMTIKEAWNSEQLKALRKAFLEGKKPTECSWCWKEEDNGVESYRQHHLKYKSHYFENLDLTIDTSPNPRVFDLKLSNVCNLKCRMCSPVASSSIFKEKQSLGELHSSQIKEYSYWLSNKILGTENESDFFDWLPHIDKIELTGGEPLVSYENNKLIGLISESPYASQIELVLTTNCTYYSPKLVEELSKFKNVKICASIDDLGKRLEYARHGSNWLNIEKNILKYKDTGFVFNIWATVNNYNIWYLDSLIEYFDNIDIEIVLGVLHEPEPLCIAYLPNYVKDCIVDKYHANHKNYEMLKPILSFLNSSIEDKSVSFLNYTRKLDNVRNESFSEVFPEWKNILYYGTL